MGRIAGVTADETREKLLHAAAVTFESQGYDGTRVADIANAAGLSNGAMYGHFGSKAELLAAALQAHGSANLAALFLDDPDHTVVDLLVTIGSHLADPVRGRGALVVEALVAARRDPELATLLGEQFRQRDEWLTDVIRSGQGDGALASEIAPDVLSRFSLMLLLGSLLVPVSDLPPVDPEDWSAFISRLAEALLPDPPTATNANGPRTPTTQETS